MPHVHVPCSLCVPSDLILWRLLSAGRAKLAACVVTRASEKPCKRCAHADARGREVKVLTKGMCASRSSTVRRTRHAIVLQEQHPQALQLRKTTLWIPTTVGSLEKKPQIQEDGGDVPHGPERPPQPAGECETPAKIMLRGKNLQMCVSSEHVASSWLKGLGPTVDAFRESVAAFEQLKKALDGIEDLAEAEVKLIAEHPLQKQTGSDCGKRQETFFVAEALLAEPERLQKHVPYGVTQGSGSKARRVRAWEKRGVAEGKKRETTRRREAATARKAPKACPIRGDTGIGKQGEESACVGEERSRRGEEEEKEAQERSRRLGRLQKRVPYGVTQGSGSKSASNPQKTNPQKPAHKNHPKKTKPQKEKKRKGRFHEAGVSHTGIEPVTSGS